MLSKNVKHNLPNLTPDIRELIWYRCYAFWINAQRGQTDLSTFPQYDMILCADLVYHHKLVTPLLKAIYQLSRFDSTIFFIFESHDARAASCFWKKVGLYFEIDKVSNMMIYKF